ncbi:unnamed protein product [Peronospora farinosa]|uniref:Protein kinase domain-containing protein n=1 Tax=Peronospora farinosa TaxID=134698 RepID=A0AAV0SYZ2_9STRA|nr:unnamed protein product [Peronospora farinosa]
MGLFSLECAIVGQVESTFAVKIDDGQMIGELKEVIKAETATISCDARDLQLFPAKTIDGKWLLSSMEDAKKLKKGETTALIEALTHKDRELQGEDPIADFFADTETQKAEEMHVLVVVPEEITSLESKMKRRRLLADEDAPDYWMVAIDDEQVTALPLTCEDLRKHLQRALRVKVPISDESFQLIREYNTTGECTSTYDKLFEPVPRRAISDGASIVGGSFVDPLFCGCSGFVSKATYHFLWDSLIAVLFKRISNGTYLRYRNESSSIDLGRPDLCYYCKYSDVCIFRGAEKASGQMQVPLKELCDKLVWKYDAASYIFGYAAVGLKVCLVIIRKDEMTERGAKVETIETYDLSDLHSRLQFFLAMLNLLTLFRPVLKLIEPLGIPEYGNIIAGNGVKISLAEDCVVKTYGFDPIDTFGRFGPFDPYGITSGSVIWNLRKVHHLMKKGSVPNVVELRKTSMKKKHVILSPLGRPVAPKNVHQLLTALRDILKALVAMHAIKIMHRDLRWPNVLKYQDKGDKWFLIDFDDAALSPASKVNHLRAETHAPEVLLSSHTVKVDIWSVGYLLRTSNIRNLPAKLITMKEKCLQENPMQRPTAVSLLKSIEELLGVDSAHTNAP